MTENILKNNYALYLFLIAGSIIGWIEASVTSNLLKKISPITLILLDTLIVGLILLIGIFGFLRKDFNKIKNEISILGWTDYIKIFSIAFFLLAFELFGVYLLKHHGVYKTTLSSYIINIGVSAVGFYLLLGEKITIKHLIGFIMISTGGFLFSR